MDNKVKEIKNIVSLIRNNYFPVMSKRELSFFTQDFIDLDTMVNTNFETYPDRDSEISSIRGYVKDILNRCRRQYGE